MWWDVGSVSVYEKNEKLRAYLVRPLCPPSPPLSSTGTCSRCRRHHRLWAPAAAGVVAVVVCWHLQMQVVVLLGRRHRYLMGVVAVIVIVGGGCALWLMGMVAAIVIGGRDMVVA